MSSEEDTTIQRQVEGFEQDTEGYQRVSETRINILKEDARIRIEDQNEKLDVLRNQVDRLQTIKYGILAAILIAGFYNGAESLTPTLIDTASSLLWFIIVGFTTVIGKIYRKDIEYFLQPFLFGENSSQKTKLVDDELVQELIEVSEIHQGEESITLERKAQKISENNREIRKLERDLRYSNLILFVILISVPTIGLPSFTILELLSLPIGF